nr:putative feruloyl esterase b-2 [Quercus suber]
MYPLLGTASTLLALLPIARGSPVYSDPTAACEALGRSFASRTHNVTVTIAQYLSAGTNLTLDQTGAVVTCAEPFQLVPVDLCRIAMHVQTSPRSEITLETWLPTGWNSRFLSTGNGGESGCVLYPDVAYAAGLGFATVGANNGHNGTGGKAFYQNEDIVADFAYRSVHTGVVVGKELTQTYYKREHTKSYFLGCSTGGRQGLKSAQDFPDDFDGIVAGAPAVAWDSLVSWGGHFFVLTGTNTSATYLTPTDWALVHADVLAQCDGLDGAVDGILEDPQLCTYRPENLLCSLHARNSSGSSSCLTAAQIRTVRHIFEPYYGVDGTLIYPRMQPGSEVQAAQGRYSGQPFSFTVDWFRYVVLEDPEWQAEQLDVQDAALAMAKDPGGIATWKGDLSAFRRKGGKLLQYHGQMDAQISSEISPRYYDHVVRTMGLPSHELDKFYRFFRISGMGHCEGGDGAWQIGQTASGTAGSRLDPQHNVLMRMVEWVERGGAPETLSGVKFINVSFATAVLEHIMLLYFEARVELMVHNRIPRPWVWRLSAGTANTRFETNVSTRRTIRILRPGDVCSSKCHRPSPDSVREWCTLLDTAPR